MWDKLLVGTVYAWIAWSAYGCLKAPVGWNWYDQQPRPLVGCYFQYQRPRFIAWGPRRTKTVLCWQESQLLSDGKK